MTALSSPTDFMVEVSRLVNTAPDLDALALSLLRLVQKHIGCSGAALWLYSHEQEMFRCARSVGTGHTLILGQRLSANLFRRLYQTGGDEVVQIDSIEPADPVVAVCAPSLPTGTHTALLTPLWVRDTLVGSLQLYNKRTAPTFLETDAEWVHHAAPILALGVHNALLTVQFNRNTERQVLLEQISRHFQQTLDLDDLIPSVLNEVNKAIQAEAQSIWLMDESQNALVCKFATGPGAEQVKQVVVSLSRPSIVGETALKQKPSLIEDAQNDPRLFRGADSKTGLVTRSLMSVPLVREGSSIGVLQAMNKRNGMLFSQDDLQLFQRIADSAALALENARLFQELQASYDSTLDALTRALDLRDRETEGHSRRVVEYTTRLAVQMGLEARTIAEFRRGALIHDVGKIGVPDAVLHKPGPLDPTERAEIEKHPLKGYEMLLGIPHLREEIKIVLRHQEKWDGTGYPYGLKGEQIPLGARLFAIADTFDALTSDRPYRQGRPYEVARRIIQEEAGRQFDPQVVEAFLAVPPEEWTSIRAQVMDEVRQRRTLEAERAKQDRDQWAKHAGR